MKPINPSLMDYNTLYREYQLAIMENKKLLELLKESEKEKALILRDKYAEIKDLNDKNKFLENVLGKQATSLSKVILQTNIYQSKIELAENEVSILSSL